MGEGTSAGTQRELAELRSAIDRDVDAVMARVREDIDPRNLIRRQPLAVLGSTASVAAAAVLGIITKRRQAEAERLTLDALAESVGGRLGKLKGDARKRFRKELQKELAEVEKSGPKEAVWAAAVAALTALATDLAQRLGNRLLADEPGPEVVPGRRAP
ncbi:MAG: hypothetical protein ACRDGT_02620 [Candidatus Limnocylindria bacterium]